MQDRATTRPQITSDVLIMETDDDGDDDDEIIEEGTAHPVENADDSSITSSCKSRNTKTTRSDASYASSKKKARTRTKDDPFHSVFSVQMKAIAEATRHHKQIEQLKEKELLSMQKESKHKERIEKLKEQELELAHRLSLVDAYERVKGKLSNDLIKKNSRNWPISLLIMKKPIASKLSVFKLIY